MPLLFTPANLARLLWLSACWVPGLLAQNSDGPAPGLEALAGVSWQRDDNLFRRTQGAEQADSIRSAYLGVAWDARYSLQRFVLNGVITDYQFDRNSNLDYQGKNLSAAWLWSLSPRLTGKLDTQTNEQLNSFVDYDGTAKNLRKSNAQSLEAQWLVWGGWGLLAGVQQETVTNGVQYFASGDYQTQGLKAGLVYGFSSGNSLSLSQLQNDGRFAKRSVSDLLRIDSGFQQAETRLDFVWQASGKTSLKARLGRISREHDHFAERDYSGTTGSLNLVWRQDNRLSLEFNAKRDLVSYQSNLQGDLPLILAGEDYFNSSYYSAQVISGGPRWQITPKTAARFSYSQENREYRGGLLTGVSQRSDTLEQELASLEWQPCNPAKINLSWQRQSRDSNLHGAGFTSQMLSLGLSTSF